MPVVRRRDEHGVDLFVGQKLQSVVMFNPSILARGVLAMLTAWYAGCEPRYLQSPDLGPG